MRKAIVTAAAAAALVLAASPGAAGRPNNQGCFGEDMSTYARDGSSGPILAFEGGSGFGQFNAWFARVLAILFGPTPGMGWTFQNHMAGLHPDAVIENSCND